MRVLMDKRVMSVNLELRVAAILPIAVLSPELESAADKGADELR